MALTNFYDPIEGMETLNEINRGVVKLQELLSCDFLLMNKLLKNYNTNANIINSDKNISYINNIITDLQYNDIISQKLAHIVQLNNSIKDDLLSQSIDECTSMFASIAYEIMLLNIGQLNKIQQEFEEVIERMRINLDQIEKIIASSSSVSLNLSGFFNNAETVTAYNDVINSIIHELLQGIEICKMTERDRMERILAINNIYTVESEREILREIFQVENVRNAPENDIELF